MQIIERIATHLARQSYRRANRTAIWRLYFANSWGHRALNLAQQRRNERREALRRAANIAWYVSQKPNP